MAKFPLMSYSNIYDSLLFWLKKYLKFKIMTLSNKNAKEEDIQKAFLLIEKAKTFEEIHEIAKKIKKQVPFYTYYYPVSRFLKWLSSGVIENIKDIDLELTLEWLTQATSGKKDTTKLNYKDALINFFKFLNNNNEEQYNFNIDLKYWQKNLSNISTKTPSYLTEKEIYKFLETLRNYKFTQGGNKAKVKENIFLKALYTLVIKIALYGGLRISEIANLKLEDLYVDKDSDSLIIYVKNSKNNKYRLVPFVYEKGKFAIKKDLDFYLEEREKMVDKCPEMKEYLFFTPFCKKISSSTMERVLSKILKESGILTEKKGMHLLRHTHASFFYKKTQDPILLKERLGHSDIRTTMKYTHIDEEKIKKSVDVMR